MPTCGTINPVSEVGQNSLVLVEPRTGEINLLVDVAPKFHDCAMYLHAYDSVAEARASIGRYLGFYNAKRPHQSLDRRTTDDAYFNPPTPIPATA